MYAPLALFAFILSTAGIQGDWQAIYLATSNGTVELLADTIVLELHHGRFRLVWGDGEGQSRVSLDARAGHLDLVGKQAKWYGTYSLDESTGLLTLGLWISADDRQPSPSTKRGRLVLVFERQ
jgi:hypothetical protein